MNKPEASKIGVQNVGALRKIMRRASIFISYYIVQYKYAACPSTPKRNEQLRASFALPFRHHWTRIDSIYDRVVGCTKLDMISHSLPQKRINDGGHSAAHPVPHPLSISSWETGHALSRQFPRVTLRPAPPKWWTVPPSTAPYAAAAAAVAADAVVGV